MKTSAPTANHHQRQGDFNNLVTPQMRQHIRQLEHDLDECDYRLSRHLELLDNVRDGLEIARQTARCLLTNDPFAAWEKVREQAEDEWEPRRRPSTAGKEEAKAAVNVKKLITRQMRKQVVDAKGTLDEYARCLCEFFEDVTKLESLDTALELAEAMNCDKPLETLEARKKREAEATAAEGFEFEE